MNVKIIYKRGIDLKKMKESGELLKIYKMYI